jgi:hypothetical protein
MKKCVTKRSIARKMTLGNETPSVAHQLKQGLEITWEMDGRGQLNLDSQHWNPISQPPEVKRPNFANLVLFISNLKGCHGQPCFQNTASAIEKDVSHYTEALPTM